MSQEPRQTHTPAPWQYSRYNRLWFGISPCHDPNSVICSIWRDNEPDARLIAAAPELLNACKVAVEQLAWQARFDTSARDTAELLTAAIAKATGAQV